MLTFADEVQRIRETQGRRVAARQLPAVLSVLALLVQKYKY
jgi:hypothetical protein